MRASSSAEAGRAARVRLRVDQKQSWSDYALEIGFRILLLVTLKSIRAASSVTPAHSTTAA